MVTPKLSPLRYMKSMVSEALISRAEDNTTKGLRRPFCSSCSQRGQRKPSRRHQVCPVGTDPEGKWIHMFISSLLISSNTGAILRDILLTR